MTREFTAAGIIIPRVPEQHIEDKQGYCSGCKDDQKGKKDLLHHILRGIASQKPSRAIRVESSMIPVRM